MKAKDYGMKKHELKIVNKVMDHYMNINCYIGKLPSNEDELTADELRVELKQFIRNFAYEYVNEMVGNFEELLTDEYILAIHLAIKYGTTEDGFTADGYADVLTADDIRNAVRLAKFDFEKQVILDKQEELDFEMKTLTEDARKAGILNHE